MGIRLRQEKAEPLPRWFRCLCDLRTKKRFGRIPGLRKNDRLQLQVESLRDLRTKKRFGWLRVVRKKVRRNHGLSANANYGQNSGLGAGLSYGWRFRKRNASPDWTWGPGHLQIKRSPSPGDWKASANYGNGGWKASATYSWRKRSASPDWTITWKSG